MPPKPISRLKAVAKSPTIAISVSSCRKKGGSARGARASPTATSPSQPPGRIALLLRSAEQPPRPHDQHDGHDGEEEHDGHGREDQDPERLQQPHQQRADEAA